MSIFNNFTEASNLIKVYKQRPFYTVFILIIIIILIPVGIYIGAYIKTIATNNASNLPPTTPSITISGDGIVQTGDNSRATQLNFLLKNSPSLSVVEINNIPKNSPNLYGYRFKLRINYSDEGILYNPPQPKINSGLICTDAEYIDGGFMGTPGNTKITEIYNINCDSKELVSSIQQANDLFEVIKKI